MKNTMLRRAWAEPGIRMGGGFLLALVLVCATAPIWAAVFGLDAYRVQAGERYLAPSWAHWLGTDDLGRDVMARLFIGGQISLSVAFATTVLAMSFGAAVGLWAGYHGGWADRVLLRSTDALRALPRLPLMILLLAVDPKKLGFDGASSAVLIGKLVFIIVFFGWTSAARLARASAIELRGREFVLAARGLGLSSAQILRRHVLPSALAPLIVAGALMFGEVILYESVLSYLGLGVQPPTPSWGAMLRNGLSHLYRAPALTVVPGLLTFATVAAFNFMGDALRDALDPRLTAVREEGSGLGERPRSS